ncbi:MAG TPA: LOG family protein, partial [Armatimonadota bacterium]|nr:LOG family protein [Armatimonadota bacterium]
MTLTLDEARERLRATVEEYIKLDAELRALENTNYRVCIFGSARIWPKDPIYHQVFSLAQSLSERGIDVVTGGGPGLMEAANRGVSAAKHRRSKSYGLPLDLPTLVERPNRHLDIKSAHKRFSSRLDEFIRLSHAVVVAPGGIGTLLELMYVWQLLQLRTVEPRPMILLGQEYWSGLMDWMRAGPAAMRLVDPRDLEYVTVVDRPDEALAVIEGSYRQFLADQELRRTEEHVDAERLLEAAEGLANQIA